MTDYDRPGWLINEVHLASCYATNSDVSNFAFNKFWRPLMQAFVEAFPRFWK